MKQKSLIIILAVGLVLSIAGNVFQYTTNQNLNAKTATLQSDMASK